MQFQHLRSLVQILTMRAFSSFHLIKGGGEHSLFSFPTHMYLSRSRTHSLVREGRRRGAPRPGFATNGAQRFGHGTVSPFITLASMSYYEYHSSSENLSSSSLGFKLFMSMNLFISDLTNT